MKTLAADAFTPRRFTSTERLMWLTPDRVFYAGLLGNPAMHTKGTIIVFVAIEGLLRLRIENGPWQIGELMVVQPYVRYEIACEGRHVLEILVEPETVEFAHLPPLLKTCGIAHAPMFAAHVRSVHQRLVRGEQNNLKPEDFDGVFFGAALHPRELDPRIAAVLSQFKLNPSAPLAAENCAAQVNLSFSRFLHLFKEQIGASFRCVRIWKRARSMLHYVNQDSKLVDVALEIGYPDSTHFSHSIRQTYGLKPKDIFSGSRKLRIIAEAPRLSTA